MRCWFSASLSVCARPGDGNAEITARITSEFCFVCDFSMGIANGVLFALQRIDFYAICNVNTRFID